MPFFYYYLPREYLSVKEEAWSRTGVRSRTEYIKITVAVARRTRNITRRQRRTVDQDQVGLARDIRCDGEWVRIGSG